MGTKAEKKRVMGLTSSNKCRQQLKEIWLKANPGEDFDAHFPKTIWKWMDVWSRIRHRNLTLNLVVDAFASKITTANADKRRLEQVIVAQRKELTKRYAELKALSNGTNQAMDGGLREMESTAPRAGQIAEDRSGAGV